jgi:nitrite reductase/ring-hydroxylating ferredoxin subunit
MKTKVAELASLEDGKSHCVKTEGLNLLLVKRDGAVHALENKCPHIGLPLARGKIEGDEIVCPFHGSRFNIRTGENTDWVAAVAGVKIPPWSSALLSFGKKPQPVKTYAVSVEGGAVFVEH